MTDFLQLQMIGAGLAAIGIVASGLIADKVGRRTTLGTLAALIAVFSFFGQTMRNQVAGMAQEVGGKTGSAEVTKAQAAAGGRRTARSSESSTADSGAR